MCRQVDSSGDADRGQHVAGVDVEHVLLDLDGRIQPAKVRSRLPVRGRRRPSSRLAAASTKAPVQIEAIRVAGGIRVKASA
jgi:hypothetical protein